MQVREYIAWMTRLGLFSADAEAPEHDPRVCAAVVRLHAELLGVALDVPIVAVPGGLGFYRDPLAPDGPLGWALLGAVSHPAVPLTGPQIVAAGPEIAATVAAAGLGELAVVTDTFAPAGVADPSQPWANKLAWMSSPRARLDLDFAAYLASLTTDRRRTARELLRKFDETAGFRFELSPTPPSAAELDFVVTQLTRQWGEDANYALAQHLWPLAVAEVRPAQALFMRVYAGDALAFLNGYLIRGEVITSQSTSRNLELRHDGLGVVIDLKAIARLLKINAPVRHLDPTCRTGLDDPPSIEVAKRKVVNENSYKPVLLVGAPAQASAAGLPHFDTTHGWVSYKILDSDPPVKILGRAV